jgi:hypothetical protein
LNLEITMSRTMLLVAAAATLFSTAALAQTVETFPNTIKYKDTSIANGKGQTGNASLESRTLLNRDGSADVELTANGTITKVQVKAGNDTDNFNHLENDGSASFRAEGLVRGQSVAIHANVDAGGGTVVVLTEEIAKLRPDLAVSLSAPPQVMPNVPVTIRAHITENNGDVGARANCRLHVNGSEVDRAENIWVNAGGSVQCAFVHSFAAYGLADLAVFVDTTDPADWNDANNSATGTVEVANLLDAWSVHAVERQQVSSSESTSPLWHTFFEESSTHQQTEVTGWIKGPLNLEGMALSYTVSSGGTELYSDPNVRFDELRQIPWRSEICASSWSSWPSVRVCYQPIGNSDAPNGFVSFQISHAVSDAIYHSWGYNWWKDPNHPFGAPAPGVYDHITVTNGIKAPLGDSVQWDVRFTDGDGNLWHDRPFLPSLERSERQSVNPWRCGFARRYGFEVCSTSSSHTITREGWHTFHRNW